ncbi:MAG TPA: class II aldolase/adducin family protein [Butyricimonas virosa]|uniref:Class II aldolase/adducin family protein n=1 Tax=Butyricimonas virosa TaxID=544645 RepID=A0A921H5F5_9BACT|nr:class II aldolase/adducin family protein [Butyricimonas virosa]
MIEEKKKLVFAAQAQRYAGAKLMCCSSGNLSWRVGDKAFVSGTGTWLSTLEPQEIAVCDIISGQSINNVRPSMESGFHLGILRKRPEVNVVLHFQSEYATVVACLKEKPENFNVTLEVPYHVGEVAVIPYFRPGSPELAEAVITAMKEHNAVLMSNHGQVVCGKDFDEVLERALFFEMACRIIVQSRMNYTVLNEKEVMDLQVHLLDKKS